MSCMSIELKSGASTDLLTVGATSKAARVELYGADGAPLFPRSTGSYALGFQVRHTAATAAGAVLMNIRGPATKTAIIRNIRGRVCFDGTLAAATSLRWALYRGAGAANSSGGGSGVAPAATDGKKRASTTARGSAYGNWTLQDFRYDLNGTGLTTTSITYETAPLHFITIPSSATGVVTTWDWDPWNDGELDSGFELAANDHLALRIVSVASIIGAHIHGSVEWDEV